MHPHVHYLAVGLARFDILAERGFALYVGIFVVDHFFHDRSEGHHAHAQLACACHNVFWQKAIHLSMVVGRQLWVEQSRRDENGGVAAGIGFEEPRNLGGCALFPPFLIDIAFQRHRIALWIERADCLPEPAATADDEYHSLMPSRHALIWLSVISLARRGAA